jgi:glycine/D-amino acid oxidase-like deaminating enzyme
MKNCTKLTGKTIVVLGAGMVEVCTAVELQNRGTFVAVN